MDDDFYFGDPPEGRIKEITTITKVEGAQHTYVAEFETTFAKNSIKPVLEYIFNELSLTKIIFDPNEHLGKEITAQLQLAPGRRTSIFCTITFFDEDGNPISTDSNSPIKAIRVSKRFRGPTLNVVRW